MGGGGGGENSIMEKNVKKKKYKWGKRAFKHLPKCWGGGNAPPPPPLYVDGHAVGCFEYSVTSFEISHIYLS